MQITYRTYTITDLSDWLTRGIQNGLSEQIINKVRAYSFLHNPYITNDMVVVVVARDGERIVGYTAMFPDRLVRPEVTLSCATTLYADPKYADEFIGYYVSKKLHETADGRLVIGSDIADATVLIDKLLGLRPVTRERQRFILNRQLHADSFRLRISRLLEPLRRQKQRRNIRQLHQSIPSTLRLEYTPFIDNEAYAFIVAHSQNDVFLRSQEMLNWILRYPFRVENPYRNRWRNKTLFGAEATAARIHTAKVWYENTIIGVFTTALYNTDSHIFLLYTDDKLKTLVYKSLLEDVLSFRPHQLWSLYPDFNEWMRQTSIALQTYTKPFVFTVPKSLPVTESMQFQGADGDMFA